MFRYAFSVLLVITNTAIASWFGPDNYEECLADEMKGRPMEQKSIVVSVCQKRFPELPSFVDINHEGTLNCIEEKTSVNVQIKISEKKIMLGAREIAVSARRDDFIEGRFNYVKGEAPGKSMKLHISFSSGYAGLISTDKDDDLFIEFRCRE